MGAKVVGIQVTAFAKNYSREAVIEYKIKASVLGAFTISASMVKAASELLRSIGPTLQRIPMWAWLLMISGFAYALSIEGVRIWLKQKLSTLSEATKRLGLNLVQILEPVVLEHQESQVKANIAKTSLLSEVDAEQYT